MAAKRVLEGLTLVTVGGILLANTTGVLPWAVWSTILMLWPLLLVAAGIDILGRAVGSSALRILASLVVIAGLLYGALVGAGLVAGPSFGVRTDAAAFAPRQEDATGVGRATAQIGAGVAKLNVTAGMPLAAVSGRSPLGTPSLRVDRQGDSADVRVESGSPRMVVTDRGRSLIDVSLGESVVWDSLEVDAGLSDLDLDLGSLDVREVETNVGLSSARITFGTRASSCVARVSGGLSSFTLRVPSALGVELSAENGLGSVDVPSGWTRTSDGGPFQGTWRSDGYDNSAAKLRIEVRTGLSGVRVERY